MRRLGLLLLALTICPQLANAEFKSRLVGMFLSDGRSFQLMRTLQYEDNRGRTWEAPAGWVIDGASIPRPLWSIAGSPYVGKYRDAAALHDYYCDTRKRTWQEVHDVFYEAMLSSEVDPKQARIMYLAVWAFGPRWMMTYTEPCGDGLQCIENKKVIIPDVSPSFDQKTLDWIRSPEAEGLSVDFIKRELDGRIEGEIRDRRRGDEMRRMMRRVFRP